MKTAFYTAILLSTGLIIHGCDSTSSEKVQDIQLEEVKTEEKKDEPPPPPPPLSCSDTVSFKDAFLHFVKKQPSDTATSTYLLSVWNNGSACLGIAFTRSMPAQHDASENDSQSALRDTYQANAISRTGYFGQSETEIRSSLRLQLQKIAGEKVFHELPAYSARRIIVLMEDSLKIQMK